MGTFGILDNRKPTTVFDQIRSPGIFETLRWFMDELMAWVAQSSIDSSTFLGWECQ